MKRALCFVLFTAILAGGTCFAQTKKASKDSKPAARLEFVPAPVGPANAPAVPAHPSPLNFPGVQYPRIEADNRVTFRFVAPNAQKVQVALVTPGQNSLQPLGFDMVKGDDGAWTYTSPPQSPGYHNYWMLVDGAPVLDPGTNAFIGYSHMCNGYEIPEAGVDWYDLKDVPHGDVLLKNYYAAKTTKTWRHILVYTPPGYEASTTTRYPVLYIQHGGGEDERVWIEMGRTNVILDNLLAAGKIKPFIVVMETSYGVGAGGAIPGTPNPQDPNHSFGVGAGRGPGPGPGPGQPPAGGAPATPPPPGGAPTGPPGGYYGQLMVNDLIPWIDSHFRTLADQGHRAMAGLSMGGGQTATVTMANLDKFSHIGFFSGGPAIPRPGPNGAPAPPIDFKTAYNGAMADAAEFNKKVKVLFMGFGTDLPIENPEGLKKHQEDLIAHGITNSYVYISPGTTHEWQTWRRDLYGFAQLLFR